VRDISSSVGLWNENDFGAQSRSRHLKSRLGILWQNVRIFQFATGSIEYLQIGVVSTLSYATVGLSSSVGTRDFQSIFSNVRRNWVLAKWGDSLYGKDEWAGCTALQCPLIRDRWLALNAAVFCIEFVRRRQRTRNTCERLSLLMKSRSTVWFVRCDILTASK